MSNEAKVGTFIIVALIIFVVTFISVANIQVGGQKNHYRTYFSFAGGIDTGNVVRFGGLKAGVVTKVRPWREDPTRIEVLMEVRSDVPVNTKSVAKIASLSALGQNYLEITPGEFSAPRIQTDGVIPSVETITLDDITKKISGIADTAQIMMRDVSADFRAAANESKEVLRNLEKLTSEKNQRNVEAMLENTNALVVELRPKLNEMTDQISATLNRMDGLADDLQKVARSADTTIGNVNELIAETRPDLKRDLEELGRTLVEARQLIEEVGTLVSSNEENIHESAENFRVASENIEQLTDELRQRPWSLIRIMPKEDRRVPLPAAAGN